MNVKSEENQKLKNYTKSYFSLLKLERQEHQEKFDEAAGQQTQLINKM